MVASVSSGRINARVVKKLMRRPDSNTSAAHPVFPGKRRTLLQDKRARLRTGIAGRYLCLDDFAHRDNARGPIQLHRLLVIGWQAEHHFRYCWKKRTKPARGDLGCF